jgi:negative regulator of replication initiation
MSQCRGSISVCSKIDKQMLDYIDAESERLGVSRAEFLRRLLELYRDSRREQVDCPECDSSVVFDLRE